MSQRKWVLTKIGPGDYLLPSNDTRTLWRISSYHEDGSLTRWDGEKQVVVRGTEWQLAYYTGDVNDTFPDDAFAADGWTQHWRTYATGYPTRKAAVDDAVQSTPA